MIKHTNARSKAKVQGMELSVEEQHKECTLKFFPKITEW
jgi:hypothetical protein